MTSIANRPAAWRCADHHGNDQPAHRLDQLADLAALLARQDRRQAVEVGPVLIECGRM